jgi:GTPase SAR1 family protein
MGNCFGVEVAQGNDKGTNDSSTHIEADRKRILLLGSGDSGKSTIFRQMKFKNEGLTEFERQKAVEVIRHNILKGMCSLVRATTNLSIPIDDEQNRDRAEPFVLISESDIKRKWNDQMIDDMIELWKDKGIKQAFERRAEFQLDESISYYFTRIHEIRKEDYLPTKEDMVKSRTKTTGIVECDFMLGDHKVRLVDVGGQRNERKKWHNCFTNVSVLVYVVAISEYDMLLYEDDRTNRMSESLSLFRDTVNTPFFQNIPVVLLFNKTDIFAEKIKKKDITTAFPEYTGGCDFARASEYIKAKFLDETSKQIQVIHTVATDINDLQRAFDEISKILPK